MIFDFGGFYPLVEAAPVLNAAAPGSAIPLKVSLAGDQELDISGDGDLIPQQVPCGTLESIGGAATIKLAGNSGLSDVPETRWYT